MIDPFSRATPGRHATRVTPAATRLPCPQRWIDLRKVSEYAPGLQAMRPDHRGRAEN